MIATAVDLNFADGEYSFDLKLPQLLELQEKCGASAFAIHARVRRGRYLVEGVGMADMNDADAYVQDLFETIRLGLIGGDGGSVDGEPVKMTPALAKKLVERYCHARPLMESWELAAAILGARVHGYEPPKKAGPAQQPAINQTE